MQILILNIKKLVQVEKTPAKWIAGANMSRLNSIDNAFLLIQNGVIKDFGAMEHAPELTSLLGDVLIYNAHGRMVFPSFCDSHTHIVYAGSREIEYTDKIKGLSYEEISAILSIPVVTVKSRVSNALATLQELFHEKRP